MYFIQFGIDKKISDLSQLITKRLYGFKNAELNLYSSIKKYKLTKN